MADTGYALTQLEKRIERVEKAIDRVSTRVDENSLKLERVIAKLEQKEADQKNMLQTVAVISSVLSVLITTALRLLAGI